MVARLKSLLQKPKLRTWLFISFVLLFYITRTRAAEPLTDFYLDGCYGFMSAGEAGVIVLDFYTVCDEKLGLRSDPIQVAEFNPSGIAHAIEVKGELVFVANDSQGLLVLSKEKLLAGEELVEDSPGAESTKAVVIQTSGKALDIAVGENYAYVVDSSEDIVIIKYKNIETAPQILEEPHDVPGKAQKVKIFDKYLFVTNDQGQLLRYTINDPEKLEEELIFEIGSQINSFTLRGEYLYLATEDAGFQILENSSTPVAFPVGIYKDKLPTYDVNLKGNYAFVAAGNHGLLIFSIKDPSTIVLIGQETKLTNANLNFWIDDYVYVADGRDGLKVFNHKVNFDYDSQEQTIQQGQYNDVVVKDGIAYIAAGDFGLQVFDITNPSNPVNKFYLDIDIQKNNRDLATSLDISGDKIYLAFKEEGLRVYDISDDKQNPVKTEKLYSTAGEANDVVISNEVAYVAVGSAGLQVFDLKADSTKGYTEKTPGDALGVFVVDDYAYIAGSKRGLHIIQVSDPEKPTLINSIETPGTATAVYVAEMDNGAGSKRKYAFVAVGEEGLFIADVTDPNNLVDVASFKTEELEYANDLIVNGQTVHLLDKSDGLMTIDVKNISAPIRLGNRSTPGNALGLFLTNNLNFVADGERGLHLIDSKDQKNPVEIGFYDLPKTVTKILADGSYAYLIDRGSGLWILSLENLNAPYAVAFYNSPGEALDVAIDGNFAYIADGDIGVNIVNIEIRKNPILVSTYSDLGKAISIAVEGNNLYVGSIMDDKNVMHLLNAENKEAFKKVAVFHTTGKPNAITAYEGYTYISEGEKGLEIVYVGTPDDLDSFSANENFGLTDTRSVEILPSENLVKMDGHQNLGASDIILVADGKNGLKIFNISRPFSPGLIYEFAMDEGGEARSVSARDEYAFLSAGDQGLVTLYVWDLNRIALAGGKSDSPATGVIAALSSVDKNFRNNPNGIGDNPFHNYVFTADEALSTYQVNGRSQTEYLGEYQFIGEATVRQILYQILSAIKYRDPSLVQEKVKTRIEYIAFGLLVFIFVSIFWLIMFARFVLPIQTINDWRKAISRLWKSLWGSDGPAVLVKGGQLVSKPEKLERLGRGVARVDFNSAIVLERSSLIHQGWRKYYEKTKKAAQRRGILLPRSHVEGPGVIFTQPYETIRGAADFRTQFRIRPGVQAYTRDGIEVNNPVWVLFTLGQPPEVLDVTYVGARRAENIRVIKFDEDAIISTSDGQKRRGWEVKEFVDELDHSDKEEIHLYVQKNILRKFFPRVKTLISEIDFSDNPQKIIAALVDQIERLASRYEIDQREDVKKFLVELSNIIEQTKRKGALDISMLHWFAYRVGVLADNYSSDEMEAFHDIIYRLKIEQYSQELQKMQFPLDLVEYAQNRVIQFFKQDKVDDPSGEFILTAFRTKLILDHVITRNLENLDGNQGDDIFRAQLEVFNERITTITTGLVRIDLPMTGLFGHIARLYKCVIGVNQIASQITISDEWRFSNLGDLFRIRNTVRDIKDGLDDQEKASKLELMRYLDLLIIYDFVTNAQQQVEISGLLTTKENKAQKTAVLVNSIQKEAGKLDRVVDRALQAQAQKLKELAFGLDEQDAPELFFFVKRVDDLWRKIKSAEILVVRSFLRKSQKQLTQIQKNVQKFSTLVKSGVANGEVQKYQNDITKILQKLKTCQIPEKLLITKPPKQTMVGPYLFDRQRVVAAVYSEAQDKDRAEFEPEQMHWTQLPVHVAAQTFRDMVSREQYDYLYQLNDPDKFNLPKLKANLRRVVRNQGVLAFRFVEHINGLPLELGDELEPDELIYYTNREFKNPKVLRSRGIKVIASGFPDLLPVSVEMPSHQLDQWSAPWERDAATILSQAELQAMRVINQTRARAQREMAHTLARIMQSSSSEEALAIRVFQALEAVAVDKDNRQFLPRDTMNLLYRFQRWFIDTDDPENKGSTDGLDLPDRNNPLLD